MSYKNSVLFFLLITCVSCRFNEHAMQKMYDQIQFDKGVIERLPLYDSLVSTITDSIHLFQKKNKSNETYQAYSYSVQDISPKGYPPLPTETADKIKNIFMHADADYLEGFDVFRDSTVRIHIREYFAEAGVTVAENLSYYPNSKATLQNKYPIKDTLLANNCRYWIRLSKTLF